MQLHGFQIIEACQRISFQPKPFLAKLLYRERILMVMTIAAFLHPDPMRNPGGQVPKSASN